MEPTSFHNDRVRLYRGDCREAIRELPDCSVDSVVTDPPYNLKFMSKAWDTGETAFAPEFWRDVLRVLKPGAHVLAFGGTRTFHRLTCAIEDGGFEIRDAVMWHYGSGFPKSHNVAVAIDKMNGVGPRGKAFNMKGRGDRAEELDTNGREFPPPYEATTDAAREWQGWGTALKPATEIICLARKPLIGTIAANVLAHGTGALNIDGCRVATELPRPSRERRHDPLLDATRTTYGAGINGSQAVADTTLGRWPANVIHDGSDEVVGAFPESASGSGARPSEAVAKPFSNVRCGPSGIRFSAHEDAGSGSAARFFYQVKNGRDGEGSADRRYTDEGATNFAALPGQRRDAVPASRLFYTSKADADDRLGSKHPTVKPLDLMQYLVRLITPKGGTVLDPFAGTGTTGEAALREGMNCILIEREPEYQSDIERRMKHVFDGVLGRSVAIAKARPQKGEPMSLFPEAAG